MPQAHTSIWFSPNSVLLPPPLQMDSSLFRFFQSGVSVSGPRPDNDYTPGTPPSPRPRVSITTKTRRVRSTFTHMSSWAHQILSSRGKGDSKTCQAEERGAAWFPGPGELGSWERSQTDEHWGEKTVFPHSALAPESSAGPRLGPERLPSGLEGRGRPSPQASRPSAQLVWGPPPPPVP